MTSKENNSEGQSPLLPPETLASLTVWPGSEEARKMTVTSGRRCLESYAKFGPLGLLERILLGESRWTSTVCYLTWRVRVMKRGHLLFQLVPSTPRIDEIESGLWLTPRAAETPEDPQKFVDRNADRGPHCRSNLTSQVLWPTITRSDVEGGPVIRTAKHPRGVKLSQSVTMFPTPKERDWKGQTQRGIHAEQDSLANMDKGDGKPIGGQLNPMWVEWLMGFPVGWTDLNA